MVSMWLSDVQNLLRWVAIEIRPMSSCEEKFSNPGPDVLILLPSDDKDMKPERYGEHGICILIHVKGDESILVMFLQSSIGCTFNKHAIDCLVVKLRENFLFDTHIMSSSFFGPQNLLFPI